MLLFKIFNFFVGLILWVIRLTLLMLLILFLRWLINAIKKHIVWAKMEKVVHMALSPAEKRYKQEAVHTGYSMSRYGHGITDHYRYKTVFDGTYHKATVYFATGGKLTFELKEESKLFKALKKAVD